MTQRILVWDLPTRIFHWILVFSFAGAFVSAESEHWRDIHILLGYTVLNLIIFRLVWGFIGTRYARFSNFVRSPALVISYLGQLTQRHSPHPVGHNPVGAIVIVLLLLLGIASCVSGWLVYDDRGGDWLEEFHGFISDIMLAVVFVHITGVWVSSYLQGENLILAMMTGRKQGQSTDAISGSYPLVAILLLMTLIGFWMWAWPESKDFKWLSEVIRNLLVFVGIVE